MKTLCSTPQEVRRLLLGTEHLKLELLFFRWLKVTFSVVEAFNEPLKKFRTNPFFSGQNA